jgi:hypothetical protein
VPPTIPRLTPSLNRFEELCLSNRDARCDPISYLQPNLFGGQVGKGFPSAFTSGGFENVLKTTNDVASSQTSFFTMLLLCEGFAP